MADDGQQCLLVFAVTVSLAVLHIDDAGHAPARDDRNRQECLELVFRQVVEELESSVLRGVPRNGNLLRLLRHPAGDAFTDLHRNAANQARMGVFGGPQDQEVLCFIQQIKQTGIAARDLNDKTDDLLQHFVQIQGGPYR